MDHVHNPASNKKKKLPMGIRKLYLDQKKLILELDITTTGNPPPPHPPPPSLQTSPNTATKNRNTYILFNFKMRFIYALLVCWLRLDGGTGGWGLWGKWGKGATIQYWIWIWILESGIFGLPYETGGFGAALGMDFLLFTGWILGSGPPTRSRRNLLALFSGKEIILLDYKNGLPINTSMNFST
ncbi:hypothetical protein DFH27DRAFT_579159 [Peziza echinospora]|nr:hypothetical protein DFH27DRAFT_579159 [Peziza echinospora]